MKINYPLENLSDDEFENLVAIICEKILGPGTVMLQSELDIS